MRRWFSRECKYSNYIPSDLRNYVKQGYKPPHQETLTYNYDHVRLIKCHIEEQLASGVESITYFRTYAYNEQNSKFNLRILIYLVKNANYEGVANPIYNTVFNAMEEGYVDVLDYANSHDATRTLLKRALASKATSFRCHPNTIIWCVRNQYPITARYLYSAAWHGHIKLVQWLLASGLIKETVDEVKLAQSALHSGSMELCLWLHDTTTVFSSDHTYMSYAAGGGSIELLNWLYQTCKLKPTHTTFPDAIRYGQWHVVEWLLARGVEWSPGSLEYAVTYWNLERVKWLCDHGCPMIADALGEAMRADRLHIAKWLLERGCPYDPTLHVSYAASHGDSEVLQWLISTGKFNVNPNRIRSELIAKKRYYAIAKLENAGLLPRIVVHTYPSMHLALATLTFMGLLIPRRVSIPILGIVYTLYGYVRWYETR